MAKKKKKRKYPPPPAKEQPLNAPFAKLATELKDAVPDPAELSAPKPAAPKPEMVDESELFSEAMKGVERVGQRGPQLRAKEPGEVRPLISEEPDEELEVLADLADLVSGSGDFDLSFTNEFVRGSWSGVSEELLERLALGQFPIQDHLDLHGLAVEDALAEVADFLVQSQTRGIRHVLLVHGRGRGSTEGVPMLKRALTEALAHKRMGKRVLAFCTAQPFDGGLGAMYVLLRKWRGPGKFS